MATLSHFGKIRIIGGVWRGKKITMPSRAKYRPSADRVRETLFNCLGQQLHGLHCLDAFAGSGILGMEAASRGAAHVTFVEKAKTAATAIHTLSAQLQAPTAVHHSPLRRFLKNNQRRFDLVFLDPPFADYPNNSSWTALLSDIMPHLNPNGRVYCESNQLITPTTTVWHCLNGKKTGQVYWHIFTQQT